MRRPVSNPNLPKLEQGCRLPSLLKALCHIEPPYERQPSGWRQAAKLRPERDATSRSPWATGPSCRHPCRHGLRWHSGELQGLLSAADRALGRLDGSVLTLPNPDLFVLMYVRKEAVLSSQIEGTQSSLQDLLAAEAQLFEPSLPRDVDEVNTATFVPPPHHAVPAALGDLENFLHASDDLPPLVTIALTHVQFETIHPFLDGNGRVGRSLLRALAGGTRPRSLGSVARLLPAWRNRGSRRSGGDCTADPTTARAAP